MCFYPTKTPSHLLAIKVAKIHKVLERPFIRSDASEHRNIGQPSFDVFEICSVRADESDSSLNGRQPHIMKNDAPSHRAQFYTHTKFGYNNIKEMPAIDKDDLKARGTVCKMGECSEGSLFNEPEPFTSEAPPNRKSDSGPFPRDLPLVWVDRSMSPSIIRRQSSQEVKSAEPISESNFKGLSCLGFSAQIVKPHPFSRADASGRIYRMVLSISP